MSSIPVPESPAGRAAALAGAALVLALAVVTARNSFPEADGAAAVAGACSSQTQVDAALARLQTASSTVAAAEAKLSAATASYQAAIDAGSRGPDRLRADLARARSSLLRAKTALRSAQENYARIASRRCSGDGTTKDASVSVDFVSSSANRDVLEGKADSVEFTIDFKVTATGADIYVDGDTALYERGYVAIDGLIWSTTTDTAHVASPLATLTAFGINSADVKQKGDIRYKVQKGSARTFRLTAFVEAADDNATAAVRINALKWDTVSRDAMANLYTIDSETFRTDLVTGLNVR